MSGDGQVTLGESVIMKQSAKKVRRLFKGQVIAGFAGSVADAFTLFEKFEIKLEEFDGNLMRSAVELAKEWRSDKMLRQLEAMLIVMNKTDMLLVSGTGEAIEPDDGILAIGSGGNFALSAGRAVKEYSPDLTAEEISKASLKIAGDMSIFTNDQVTTEVIDQYKGVLRMANNLTPKQIVEKLDYYIIGQNDAKRSVAVALRNRFRRMQLN